MDEKPAFGELSAQDLEVGDIVEWKKWCYKTRIWQPNYGVITNIKNEIKGNRMVSISMVMPLSNSRQSEVEFFTPSLKLVSKVQKSDQINPEFVEKG
tara:strand:- start:226 stop:516 length:291 start_codon:yes stop_codon:yes gene_type:complete